MSDDELELSERLALQTQLSRVVGSLEIEAVYAAHNKLQGNWLASAKGESATQVSSYKAPVVVPPAPPGVDIDWNIRRAMVSMSMAWFVERLAPKGEMDYKVLGKNGIYEDFGNFNYGAMALAFGFSENAALRMAGLVQEFVNTQRKLKGSGAIDAAVYGLRHSMDFLGQPPHGDQKRDQDMIKQGFRYVREVFVQKYAIGEIRRDLNRVREAVEAEEWESVRRFPSRIYDVLH